MKPRLASVAALAVLGALGLLACNHSQRRNDWRTPGPGGSRPPATCTTDADCAPNGTCTLEIGAAQGTCGPAPGLHPLPRVDGGAPAQPGLPNHQPSSSDIQI